METFLEKVQGRIAMAGITAVLVEAQESIEHPGDVTLLFQSDCLLLKVSREGENEYLDVATVLAPGQFYWFGDIEVALGWASFERMCTATPPPIEEAINRLGQRLTYLRKEFFKSLDPFTEATIRRTVRRGTAAHGALHFNAGRRAPRP